MAILLAAPLSEMVVATVGVVVMSTTHQVEVAALVATPGMVVAAATVDQIQLLAQEQPLEVAEAAAEAQTVVTPEQVVLAEAAAEAAAQAPLVRPAIIGLVEAEAVLVCLDKAQMAPLELDLAETQRHQPQAETEAITAQEVVLATAEAAAPTAVAQSESSGPEQPVNSHQHAQQTNEDTSCISNPQHKPHLPRTAKSAQCILMCRFRW